MEQIRMRFWIGAALGLALFGAPAAGQQGQPDRPRNPFEVLVSLDANNDMVIEPGEVPESARRAFDRLLTHGDANQDGKLQLEELRGLAEKLRGLAGGRGEERFKERDADGDGKLSRTEFPGPAEMFERLDENKDGFVDRIEAARGVLGMLQPGAPMILQRLKGMDANSDGKVSRDEFQGPPPLFDRLDADRDGFVTAEEVKAFRPGPPPAPEPKPEPEKKGEAKDA